MQPPRATYLRDMSETHPVVTLCREVADGKYPTMEQVDGMLASLTGKDRVPHLIDSLLDIKSLLREMATATETTAVLTAD